MICAARRDWSPMAPTSSSFSVSRISCLGQDDAAVDRLQATIALGDSSYLEDAHLYLAKAFLRRKDVGAARTHLKTLIELRGSRSDEARRLLAQLQNVTESTGQTVPGSWSGDDTPVRRLAMACAMLLMPAVPGYSQETTGTILGALVDQTGGVLPGVKVVMTNVDTGHIREVVTNSVGQYTASLPIGNYEISFLFPNFQPFITRGITLHVNDRLQVNGTLRVGAVETLTVTAERLVQATSDVRNLIRRSAVGELPLLTRTFVQLATLVPGVSSDLREDACFCDQGNLDVSINGARRSAVNWLLDGASNVNGWNNYTLVTTPSLEAIQEINVITSSYSAEWARNGGGVVNAVTKSGSKRFSGSAYDFLRNDALNANSFFRKMSTRPRGQQRTAATAIQQLRVHARRAGAPEP